MRCRLVGHLSRGRRRRPADLRVRWDVATGTSKATLTGHTDTVNAVAFSPDGKTVATASGDHTARLWDFDPPDPAGAVEQICSAIGHEINAEEYSLYLPGQPVRRACP